MASFPVGAHVLIDEAARDKGNGGYLEGVVLARGFFRDLVRFYRPWRSLRPNKRVAEKWLAHDRLTDPAAP